MGQDLGCPIHLVDLPTMVRSLALRSGIGLPHSDNLSDAPVKYAVCLRSEG